VAADPVGPRWAAALEQVRQAGELLARRQRVALEQVALAAAQSADLAEVFHRARLTDLEAGHRWVAHLRQAVAGLEPGRQAVVARLEVARQEEDRCPAGLARSGLAGVLVPRQAAADLGLCPCQRCRPAVEVHPAECRDPGAGRRSPGAAGQR
jgi:hypothetical protein